MTEFWTQFAKSPSEKEMMLDSRAEELGKEEIPEILDLLPDYTNKDVLELGAGIGRFTGKLAEQAHSVLALDFIECFVQKNKEVNGNLSNVTIRQADVTELELDDNSVDLVFSNWLLMYLSDEEVRTLMTKILHWLKPNGTLFFRESCYHQSGDAVRSTNPTRYRTPSVYYDLLMSVATSAEDGGNSYGYDVIMQRAVQTYVKLKSNRNQVCWSVQKIHHTESHQGFKTFQQFLDNKQYSRTSILRYEKIFGRHYVSTGGKETTEEFVEMLDLKPGQKVLDVGCGIGGSAFYMAEKFGANVVGIDLSSNMINIALERLQEINASRLEDGSSGYVVSTDTTPAQTPPLHTTDQVDFEVCDATKRQFPSGSFDVVYSRDTILHIRDKKALFTTFLDWLKPGGKLLITDYCCSDGDHSKVFQEYVARRGYILLSPPAYGKVLEDVGLVKVRAEDRTDQFMSVLRSEVARAESIKEQFIKEFSLEDYEAIVCGWHDKLYRVGLGDQRWGLFYAEKADV